MTDEQSIFEFLKTARELQHTYRFTPHPNGSMENDAEHSWSVALICMLLASRLEKEFDTKLDHARMLKMSLIHDLAEIQTGDTKPWEPETRINKEEKEREAMHNLTTVLPEDLKTEIMNLWEECEKRETLEAKIVKSIDRFDPVLHRTAFGIGWESQMEDQHARVEALNDRQLPRHSFSTILTRIYETIRDEAVTKGMFKVG